MTIVDTLKALTRRPTRIELVLNFCFWVVLATGHAAQTPKGFYNETQTDTSGWVIAR